MYLPPVQTNFLHVRFMMLPLLLLSFVSLALANPVLVSDAREGRTLDQIYRAALKEKSPLRVAWGGDTKVSRDRIIAAFNKEYPGIVLDLKCDVSKYLDSMIDRTYQATDGNDDGADVAVLQTLHDFTRWKEEKRLMSYKVIPFDDIHTEFADPQGAYTGCFVSSFGSIIYNPSFADNSTLPTSYIDVLKPEWADKLILTYPNDDDAVLYLFTLLTEKYGFQFIESLVKTQRARWVRGTATPSFFIGLTESNSTQDAHSISFTSSNAFEPKAAFTVPEDTYMAWPQTGAIFATTKVPESAKLFMNFLLSDTWQIPLSGGRFSVRKAHDTAGIFKQEHVEPLGFGRFMADRAEVERWRLQFESFLGPPQGPNPVTVV